MTETRERVVAKRNTAMRFLLAFIGGFILPLGFALALAG